MRRLLALGVLALSMGGCAAQENGAMQEPEELALGPIDGHELPGVDLERVQVGDVAPDFVLTSLVGPPVQLSTYRGAQNVVLVFYRGHW